MRMLSTIALIQVIIILVHITPSRTAVGRGAATGKAAPAVATSNLRKNSSTKSLDVRKKAIHFFRIKTLNKEVREERLKLGRDVVVLFTSVKKNFSRDCQEEELRSSIIFR